MTCESCSKAITREDSLEVGEKHYCQDCFYKVAQPFRANLTPEQRAQLREMVGEEVEGVLPRAAIRQIIQDAITRILSKKADPEEEINHAVNRIEQIAGIAMFREMLNVLQSIRGGLDGPEEELREKLRKLTKLDAS